jgi:hypothetical protein
MHTHIPAELRSRARLDDMVVHVKEMAAPMLKAYDTLVLREYDIGQELHHLLYHCEKFGETQRAIANALDAKATPEKIGAGLATIACSAEDRDVRLYSIRRFFLNSRQKQAAYALADVPQAYKDTANELLVLSYGILAEMAILCFQRVQEERVNKAKNA